MTWEIILTGAVTAAGWSLIGYGESKVREKGEFDFLKFLETVIVGAVIGGLASLLGLDLDANKDWVLQASLMGGAVAAGKKVWNAIKSLF